MTTAMSTHEPLKLTEKLRLLLGCGLAIGLFWPLGRMILAAPDPLAALSLAGRPVLLAGWLYMSAIAVVAACLGAILIGGRRTYGGTFCAAVGLAALNMRFGTVQRALATAGPELAQRKALFASLIGETLLWTAALGVAFLAESLVVRWLVLAPPGDAGRDLAAKRGGRTGSTTPGWAIGLLAIGVASVVSVAVLSQVIARSDTAIVQRNQVYFALLLAFFLGCFVSCQVVPAAADLGHLLTPAVVACLGYSWAWWQPVARGLNQYYQAIPELPANRLARALPVEYLSVGLAGALMGLWLGRRLYAARREGAAS